MKADQLKFDDKIEKQLPRNFQVLISSSSSVAVVIQCLVFNYSSIPFAFSFSRFKMGRYSLLLSIHSFNSAFTWSTYILVIFQYFALSSHSFELALLNIVSRHHKIKVYWKWKIELTFSFIADWEIFESLLLPLMHIRWLVCTQKKRILSCLPAIRSLTTRWKFPFHRFFTFPINLWLLCIQIVSEAERQCDELITKF